VGWIRGQELKTDTHHAERGNQIEVRFQAVVVIAGDFSVGTVRDGSRKTAEFIHIEAPLPSAAEAPSIWNALLATPQQSSLESDWKARRWIYNRSLMPLCSYF